MFSYGRIIFVNWAIWSVVHVSISESACIIPYFIPVGLSALINLTRGAFFFFRNLSLDVHVDCQTVMAMREARDVLNRFHQAGSITSKEVQDGIEPGCGILELGKVKLIENINDFLTDGFFSRRFLHWVAIPVYIAGIKVTGDKYCCFGVVFTGISDTGKSNFQSFWSLGTAALTYWPSVLTSWLSTRGTKHHLQILLTRG